MTDHDFESQAVALLDDLSEFLQTGELQFDPEDDTCTVTIEETIDVNITPNGEEETIVLHLVVGIIPPENREAVLEQLLEANLFWAGTKGATLSMERRSSSVFMMRALTLYAANGEALTGEELAKAINDFATAAKYARVLLDA